MRRLGMNKASYLIVALSFIAASPVQAPWWHGSKPTAPARTSAAAKGGAPAKPKKSWFSFGQTSPTSRSSADEVTYATNPMYAKASQSRMGSYPSLFSDSDVTPRLRAQRAAAKQHTQRTVEVTSESEDADTAKQTKPAATHRTKKPATLTIPQPANAPTTTRVPPVAATTGQPLRGALRLAPPQKMAKPYDPIGTPSESAINDLYTVVKQEKKSRISFTEPKKPIGSRTSP